MAQRIYQRETYEKSRKKNKLFFFLKLFGVIVALFFLGILAIAALFVYYAKDLPRPEKFTERPFVESTKIYDRTGKTLLYEMYGEEKRDYVPLNEISDYLKQAAISTEDAKFYSHNGLDFVGIFRAFKINWELKKPLYGGSTISQQLIRSTFLTLEKSAERKIREIILTLELERRYEKDQILEWYLNQIPFGPNIYGAESASQTYFNKPAKELSLAEAASLAAMIQAPSYLSPYGQHTDELFIRKDYVLKRMANEHYITQEEAEQAKKEELKFTDIETTSIKAPHFVFYVQNYLLEKYGRDFLEKGGLKVYTTLNWDFQQKAEEAVKKGVENNKMYNGHNASLVSIDPKTGEILAMVGSADWFGDPEPEGCVPGKNCLFDPKLNVATYKIGRQPGSAFKPFVYATAFYKEDSQGNLITDKYVVIDEQTNFGDYGGKPYIPQNYDGLFRGPVTLRQALAQSLNIPSVKVLAYLAGQKESIDTAKKLGITTLNQPYSFYGLSIVLGGGEVKLIDMVSAYGVFATEGLRVPVSSILKIEDSESNIIEQNSKTLRLVLNQKSAILINDILSDNSARTPIFGANSVMYFKDEQVAAKTGTTSDYRDGWIIGYTPNIVTGVWAGNNDNTKMNKEPGMVIAGPIWKNFMNYALSKLPKESFTPLATEEPEPEKTDKGEQEEQNESLRN